jgi:hypothetical protein
MRSRWPFLIAGLMLLTGLLAGCNKEPPRMKNQPATLNQDTGATYRLPNKGSHTKIIHGG